MNKKLITVLFIAFFFFGFMTYGFSEVIYHLFITGSYTKEYFLSLAGWPKYLIEDIMSIIVLYNIYRTSIKKKQQQD